MLQRLMIIAEQVNEGVVVIDFNRIVHFVNTAMAKMHGYLSSKDLIGKKISVFHSEDQINTDVFPMIEEVKRRGQLWGPIEHLRSDGTVFPTQTKMILLKNGKDRAVGAIVFVTDITKSIQVEKFLTKRIFELDATNEQLQIQIDRHRQAEESLNEQASELTATNENLRQQVSEHQQAIDRLQQQLEDKKAELSQAGEQLEQQIIERKQSEEKLKEYHEQIKGQVEDLNAELATAEERFEQQVTECRELEEMIKENTEERYEFKDPKLPRRPVLDEEKLRSLAEMTKRLSKRG